MDWHYWLVAGRQELFHFAAIFFLLGALDELAVDAIYVWSRLTGRVSTPRLAMTGAAQAELTGPAAIFIPAWNEPKVIGTTIAHALAAWPQRGLRLYVGCYRNDRATIAAAMAGSAGDPRLRVVILDVQGPSSKADCLNRLYRALCDDERRLGIRARMIVLHDAEDMVDPHALRLLDLALDDADFVQLPVLALPQARSRWIAGHYADEFAEAHGKTMVVRSLLGRGVPGAGVGTALSRDWLQRMGDGVVGDGGVGKGPFATESLTEDYELGMHLAEAGARTRFLRVRTAEGGLVATRAYFPATLSTALRQKSRWLHGIALQGWDRMGWRGNAVAAWMQWRDRRGPVAALVLVIAYGLVVTWGLEAGLVAAGLVAPVIMPDWTTHLLAANGVLLGWRLVVRAAFTTREHGLVEGIFAMPRVLVGNVVAILAARRAMLAYIRSLTSGRVVWEKTEHAEHPALATRQLAMDGGRA